MKRFMVFCFAVLLIALFAAPVFAASTDKRVFDYARLFTAEERDGLQSMIDDHIEKYGMDLVVLTINDDEGKTSRAHADDFYDEYGFGYGMDFAGVLFLINMDYREIYVSTCGRMIDILNDARIEELLDIQYDYAKNGSYYGAMVNSIGKTADFIDAGPVSGQYRYHEGHYLEPWWIAVSIAIGVGTAFIVAASINKIYQKEYKPVAYDYKSESRLSLSQKTDDLIDKQVARRYNPPPPPSSSSGSSGGSSSGSRSTTHRSSSGRSHGGGGRRF